MAERADPRLPGFQEGRIYREKLFERYEFCNAFIEDKVVLDIPCGVGWGTSLLKGAKEIHAVDIDNESIGYGKQEYPGITFKVGDMSKIPYGNYTFDVIICLEGYEHIDQQTQLKFINEARRVLIPNGIIILTTPILENGKSTNNKYHIHEPSFEEAQDTLTQNFIEVHLEVFKGPDSKEIRFIGKNR